MILAHVALIEIVGFYMMTALFLVAYMKYLGAKSYPVMLGTTAGLLAFIYGLFTCALGTPLPHGFLY